MNDDSTSVVDRAGRRGELHRTDEAVHVHFADGQTQALDATRLTTAAGGGYRYDGTFSDVTDTVRIPLAQEYLSVQKATRETGTVRVAKRVEEETEAVSAMLTHETVDVERIPVGRVVTARPDVRQEGDVTIVPVVEERLVVRKELVLTEEIRLTRRRETEAVEEAHTIRRERAEVTRHPAKPSG